jgi:preprotein translocase subunit SecA
VSKTIESAQTRVEGYNFDIRKRVVEFDDVINKQRETIYAERDKVLRNEDLGETISGFVVEELQALADQHLSGQPEEWGVEAFSNELRRMGIDTADISDDELWSLGTKEAIVERLQGLAEDKLDRKADEIGEAWSLVERLVLLRTIDSLWVDHLTELDDMRRGIGLRGYAQQDPLNEFRKEAFALYEELGGFIRHQVATTIFRVTVTREAAPPPDAPVPLPGPGQPARSGGTPGTAPGTSSTSAGGGVPPAAPRSPLGGVLGGALPAGRTVPAAGDSPNVGQRLSPPGPGGEQARPGFTPKGQRIGRNDPCWCGSGQKYKRCHGR